MINRFDLPRAYLLPDGFAFPSVRKLFHLRKVARALELVCGGLGLLVLLYAVLVR